MTMTNKEHYEYLTLKTFTGELLSTYTTESIVNGYNHIMFLVKTNESFTPEFLTFMCNTYSEVTYELSKRAINGDEVASLLFSNLNKNAEKRSV